MSDRSGPPAPSFTHSGVDSRDFPLLINTLIIPRLSESCPVRDSYHDDVMHLLGEFERLSVERFLIGGARMNYGGQRRSLKNLENRRNSV